MESNRKYAQAISGHISWIKEKITNSQDGIVTIKVREFAKEMGPDFEIKNDDSIYWGLKYVFFHEGISVELGTDNDRENVLKMRTKSVEDKLIQHVYRDSQM